MRTIKVKLATPGKLVHNPSTASPLPGHKDGEECSPVDVPDVKYWHRMLREGSVVLADDSKHATAGIKDAADGKTVGVEVTKVPDIGGKPKK
jgi:hypothetical protein